MAKRRWWEHTEAVALGMKELDRGRPGWEHHIDLDKLNVGHMGNCVLGQLFGGNWLAGLIALGCPSHEEEPTWADDRGFRCVGHEGSLTTAWKRAIQARRQARETEVIGT